MAEEDLQFFRNIWERRMSLGRWQPLFNRTYNHSQNLLVIIQQRKIWHSSMLSRTIFQKHWGGSSWLLSINRFRVYFCRENAFRENIWRESDPNYHSCIRKILKILLHTKVALNPVALIEALHFLASLLTTGLMGTENTKESNLSMQ